MGCGEGGGKEHLQKPKLCRGGWGCEGGVDDVGAGRGERLGHNTLHRGGGLVC
jgi:hypothetical protein